MHDVPLEKDESNPTIYNDDLNITDFKEFLTVEKNSNGISSGLTSLIPGWAMTAKSLYFFSLYSLEIYTQSLPYFVHYIVTHTCCIIELNCWPISSIFSLLKYEKFTKNKKHKNRKISYPSSLTVKRTILICKTTYQSWPTSHKHWQSTGNSLWNQEQYFLSLFLS